MSQSNDKWSRVATPGQTKPVEEMKAYHTGKTHRTSEVFSHHDDSVVLNPRNKYITGLNT